MTTQNFSFQFCLAKNADKILKYETEFIISHKESLPRKKIKYKIGQILCKYKHENDIHEHRKQ